MTDKDEEIQKLKQKLDLTGKLVEMLESRIDASDKLTTQQITSMSEKDEEIQRLEEALERERNRPVPITQSDDRSTRGIDLSKINAAELLIAVERRRIRW